MSFGFFSYSLPLDPQSSRAWRFAWDPIFFEFCSAVRGALLFDFSTYRRLDEASRRLYRLLRKVFWRSEVSPEFDLRHLAVDIIGFAASHEPRELKRRLARPMHRLLGHGIFRLPQRIVCVTDAFSRHARGQYSVRFHRGPHFDRPATDSMIRDLPDSPLFDPLTTIGLDRPGIRRILAAYDSRLVAECADT